MQDYIQDAAWDAVRQWCHTNGGETVIGWSCILLCIGLMFGLVKGLAWLWRRLGWSS